MTKIKIFLETPKYNDLNNNNIGQTVKFYSYKNLKEDLNVICNFFFKIFYISYGFLQFVATLSGLVKVFHHNSLILMLTSFILGFTPFLGTISGIFGAHIGWGWSFNDGLLIFFAPYLAINSPLFSVALFDMYKDWKHSKTEKKKI